MNAKLSIFIHDLMNEKIDANRSSKNNQCSAGNFNWSVSKFVDKFRLHAKGYLWSRFREIFVFLWIFHGIMSCTLSPISKWIQCLSIDIKHSITKVLQILSHSKLLQRKMFKPVFCMPVIWFGIKMTELRILWHCQISKISSFNS